MSSERSERLSDEQLAAIRARWQWRRKAKIVTVYGQAELFREWADHAADDETALLADHDALAAENKRLRDERDAAHEQIAKMRSIIAAVAEFTCADDYDRRSAKVVAHACHISYLIGPNDIHSDHCAAEQARALVAQWAASTSAHTLDDDATQARTQD